tara:strand:- start:2541 stop:2930 length:390 start_codon:yes stop_codon:yes gene_type:complete
MIKKIFTKGSKLYSIINNVCPRCQLSEFWPKNNPYKNIFVKNGGDIGHCKNCNLKYEIEVGFWYGAMYVSYFLSILTALISWFFLSFFCNKIELSSQYIIISTILIVSFPIIYFYSRLLWINIYISFRQ